MRFSRKLKSTITADAILWSDEVKSLIRRFEIRERNSILFILNLIIKLERFACRDLPNQRFNDFTKSGWSFAHQSSSFCMNLSIIDNRNLL